MYELESALDKLLEAFETFDRLLNDTDPFTWDRWRAGGKRVSPDFVSPYPTAEQAFEIAADKIDDDDNQVNY